MPVSLVMFQVVILPFLTPGSLPVLCNIYPASIHTQYIFGLSDIRRRPPFLFGMGWRMGVGVGWGGTYLLGFRWEITKGDAHVHNHYSYVYDVKSLKVNFKVHLCGNFLMDMWIQISGT